MTSSKPRKPSPLDIIREGFFQTLGRIVVTKEAGENAIGRALSQLIELGKITQEEAKNFTSELKAKIEKNRNEIERLTDNSINRALAAVSFPKRDVLTAMKLRIADLERKIDRLEAVKARKVR